MKSKAIFDELEGHEMRKARTRSNPFEIIHGVFFLNRAAMKMANMDAVFEFMFTEPSKCLTKTKNVAAFSEQKCMTLNIYRDNLSTHLTRVHDLKVPPNLGKFRCSV